MVQAQGDQYRDQLPGTDSSEMVFFPGSSQT